MLKLSNFSAHFVGLHKQFRKSMPRPPTRESFVVLLLSSIMRGFLLVMMRIEPPPPAILPPTPLSTMLTAQQQLPPPAAVATAAVVLKMAKTTHSCHYVPDWSKIGKHKRPPRIGNNSNNINTSSHDISTNTPTLGHSQWLSETRAQTAQLDKVSLRSSATSNLKFSWSEI